MAIPIFSQTNNNGNINSNCFETQYQWQWQYQFLFKPISMAIPIAIVVPRQYQWQYQYQLFSTAISMSMAISIVSIALSQYQCSINQYLSKLININGNVNCSKNTLSIVNGNDNTSKIVNTNGCQYYCSCLARGALGHTVHGPLLLKGRFALSCNQLCAKILCLLIYPIMLWHYLDNVPFAK